MFENIIVVWDHARKLKTVEKKKTNRAFSESFAREMKEHPEWYIGDGPDDPGHDEDEGVGFWRNYYAKQKPPPPRGF
ncbi:MAG: hypothetical protein AAB391_00280 [Patescibacteria group bacterium]